MTAVLRLTPTLAIMPGAVASVEVIETSDSQCIMATVGPDYRRCRNGHAVVVRYLMSTEPVRVAVFTVPPHSKSPSRTLEDLESLLADTEARALAIYEQILHAVSECEEVGRG